MSTFEERIVLVDGYKILTDDKSIANTFNKYFNIITEELKVPKWKPNCKVDTNDEINSIIAKFTSHPSNCYDQRRIYN